MAQLPQFCASVFKSTQAPDAVHQVCPVGHLHVPPLQSWVPGHTLPQLPQFWVSVEESTHCAPHGVSPKVEHLQAPTRQY